MRVPEPWVSLDVVNIGGVATGVGERGLHNFDLRRQTRREIRMSENSGVGVVWLECKANVVNIGGSAADVRERGVYHFNLHRQQQTKGVSCNPMYPAIHFGCAHMYVSWLEAPLVCCICICGLTSG